MKPPVHSHCTSFCRSQTCRWPALGDERQHQTYQRSLLIAGAAERCKSLEQPPPLLASEQYEGH